MTAVYTSGGVNRRPHCLAWSLVLATDPASSSPQIRRTLTGTSVVSGGADSKMLVWRVGPAGAGALLATLAVHSGPVTALILLPSIGGLTVASTATNCTICTADWRQEPAPLK